MGCPPMRGVDGTPTVGVRWSNPTQDAEPIPMVGAPRSTPMQDAVWILTVVQGAHRKGR